MHLSIPELFYPSLIGTAGPNGPLPAEIIAMHPEAPFIKRNGEVNAWDNPDFRAAVEATGKKQVILGGITTDVRSEILPYYSHPRLMSNVVGLHCIPCTFAPRCRI